MVMKGPDYPGDLDDKSPEFLTSVHETPISQQPHLLHDIRNSLGYHTHLKGKT